MKNKNNLPMNLQKQQEFKKQESINKVLRAINDMKNEGRKVTISALMEFTGLSRSTFSKPHIRELIADYGYAQKGTGSGSKGEKKTKKSSDKDKTIAELRARNAELEQECELLRGRLFLMMEKDNYK